MRCIRLPNVGSSVVENLAKIRNLWQITSDFGRHIHRYEDTVKVLRFIIPTYQCAAYEMYNNFAEQRPGRTDKIKFEQFIVALSRKLEIDYHGIYMIDDETKTFEVSDSEEEPLEDDDFYDGYNAPEVIVLSDDEDN